MDVSETKKDSTNSNVAIKYVILGNPIPLQRPRFSYGHVWDAQKKLKHAWALQLQQQQQEQFFKTGPLHLEVDFFMQMPRMSIAKKKGYENRWHITRPDTSNLIKWVEDASTGVLFDDDCIIVSVHATKRYSEKPRTEFYLKKLSAAEINEMEEMQKRSKKDCEDHIRECAAYYCSEMYCPNYR